MINSGGDNGDDSIVPFTDDERRMMRGGGYGGAALSSDPDRPTLGQRIAGDVPKPQPAPTQVADAAPPQPAFNVDPSKREHKDGVCEIFANFVDLGWGPNDVYLRLCHLVPATQASPDRFVVEVRATVNTVWAQAKFLRDVLADAIERYEIANGELKWPKPATQTAQEARDKQLLMSVPQGSGQAN